MEIRKEHLRPNDFNRICRTCLSTQNLQTISDALISIECILSKYTQIKLDSTDNLPKQICINCVNSLNNTYIFLSNCDSVNKTLIECSVRFENNFVAKDCVTNTDGDLPNTIKLGGCEIKIKEEPQETINSQCIQSTIPEAVYIKEEPLNATDNWNIDYDALESDQSDDSECTSQETAIGANEDGMGVLPCKSRARYEVAYTKFMQWHNEKQCQEITEEEILEYLTTKSKLFRASTLSSEYSMLKATLNVYQNLDISRFGKVVSLLQSKTEDYVPEKFKALTNEQIEKFLLEAPNKRYLMIKVALVIGISGALRRNEFPNITIDDIQEVNSSLIIKVPDKTTKIPRVFTVSSANETYLEIYREYLALRPKHTTHRRFFVYYKDGKCTAQVVGINTFGKLPFYIAEYLGLPNPKCYTGHCFRSSAHTRWTPSSGIYQRSDLNLRMLKNKKNPEKSAKSSTEKSSKKRRKLKNPHKHVKTPAERSRDYRQRLKKKQENERISKRPSRTSTERSREFRERQKFSCHEDELFFPSLTPEPQPSTSVQIKYEEHEQMKIDGITNPPNNEW